MGKKGVGSIPSSSRTLVVYISKGHANTKPRVYSLPLANRNRCLVVRILQDKHFGLEEGLDQLTCLGLWKKKYLPALFEAFGED